MSDILDNVLGLLLLEGSYDVSEDETGFHVAIDTKDAGRLIGFKGESLEGLQLLVTQILSRKMKATEGTEFKRVIIDVMEWRKQKEDELTEKAKSWAAEVAETGETLELEPMPSWQRRLVHLVVQDIPGLESESIGEGHDRHLVIKKT